MKIRAIVIASILCFLSFSGKSQTTNEDELWSNIEKRPYPQWFTDAKLGIFIHWGVYSVPSFGGKESYGEWYLRGLQAGDSLRTSFMKKYYGNSFTYNDFAPLFKAELFNPDEWADLFKKAGARYVVMVSKHHDGYCLWPSKYSRNWNSVDVGPKRDLVGELTQAVSKSGLKMGLYYSLPEWNNPLHRWYTDPDDSIRIYVDNYMIPQFKELVSTYRPSLIFTDGEWNNSAKQWHAAELISWYYQLIGSDAIVNDRWGAGSKGGFLTPEYSSGIKEKQRPWAEVRGLGRSFGLNRNESLDAYMSEKELIQFFVKAVANGGGMILNVGPGADGQIPLLQQERLLQLGQWLKINGEAIYGSKSYIKSEEEKPVSISRIDSKIDFDWVRNSPEKGIKEDDFTAEWSGFLVPDQSGEFLFELKADDGAQVWINNELVIDQNYTSANKNSEVIGAQTGKTTNGKIAMNANKAYSIRINYREKIQNAHIQLFWSANNAEKQIIGDKYFFQDRNLSLKGLKASYRAMKTYLCYTQNKNNLYAISFEWPDNQVVLEIPKPSDKSMITLLGTDKKLPWKYTDGKLIINTTSIKYSELPSTVAWTFKIVNFQ
jgi:alpha-L-fucosidase